ncbi:MAG: AraC family ligand binding domain-containing protein [Acidobacteriia bacterium]|jgi:mannose-6-phosphate isomerase-like protein (cupin superfamily)|nr:AraC family ligand binding domain-containing protein [Terriglobia bacterium]
MSVTIINTNELARLKTSESGEFTEILNKALCGAERSVVTLHWLRDGETLNLQGNSETHELYYVMEGEGIVTLNANQHTLKKGAGVYLEPRDEAQIKQTAVTSLKLFHLSVPKIPS